MSDTAAGMLLLIVAGVMSANFTLPMRFARKWAWEHTWLAWSVLGLVVFPVFVSFLTVPDLAGVYRQAEWGAVATIVGCGFGWGIAQLLFGLAVDALGIELAFAVILGISAAFGSILTLLTKHPDKLYTPDGMSVILGVVLTAAGVSFCAAAAGSRASLEAPRKVSFLRGLIFCVIAGIGSALIGLGLEWGTAIARAAKAAGADEIWRPNSIWLLMMLAGAIPNVGYCIHLLRKNKSRSEFKQPGTAKYWLLAGGMAILWFGSIVTYGIATIILGGLGGAVTWPIYMSLVVIAATGAGAIFHRKRGAGQMPEISMMIGVSMLIVAVLVFARAL